MTQQPPATSSDENLFAAISHFFGFIIALIVWLLQKDKSRFVRFQATQAMAFDVLVSGLMLIFVFFVVIVLLAILGIAIGDIAIFGGQNNPTAEPARALIALLDAVPFLVACLILPLGAVIGVARLIATIQTFQGINFHYPWLGDFIQRQFDHSIADTIH